MHIPGLESTELCDVHYASLNFRDIMLATGKLSIDAIPGHFVDFDTLVGSEFSGVDSTGRRVMGMVPVNVRLSSYCSIITKTSRCNIQRFLSCKK